MSCVMCDGQLKILGQLGSKLWLRCINCGIDQSEDIEQ